MRSILLASLSALLGLALLSPAAAPPTTPLRAADQLDYLFLGSDRPVLFRLHVRMGDGPYDAAWVEFMDKLFAWFDKDNDGSLSSTETARLPSVNSLLNQSRGQIGQDTTGVPFATIDTNKDGKVSKEEFRAFYKNGGFPGFQFNTNNFQATTAKQLNESIYKRLDKAGEGTLTADKVAGMYEKLRALDENEDEMLDMSELNTRTNNGLYAPVAIPFSGTMVANVAEPTLLGIVPGQEAGLVKQMMDKYDRNKDGRLTRAEVGLSAELFAKLDADKDGSLNAGELLAYLASPPDLVLRLQLGTPGTKGGKGILSRIGFSSPVTPAGPRLVVNNEKALAAPMKKSLRQSGGNALALELGDTRLSLQANGPGPAQGRRFNNAKNFYLNQYDMAAGKKGHVVRADEKGQQPFLFQIFSQADKNADGKLTRIELINWLDFVATGQDASVSITAEDLGRGLFPVLDADGDSRLSVREMKTAWARLKPLAKDGKLTQADLPRTLRITVGQANSNFFPQPVMFVGGMGGPPRPAPRGSAPVWFRKMDKNNDGDVSPREWLGTDEEFKAIDTDGDGLISADEAIKFEAKKSKKE